MLKHERILKKNHLIHDIEITLSRGHSIIPSSHLSSGEACYMATLAFILTYISDNSVIIIDEPENSLHPRWQKKIHIKPSGSIILFRHKNNISDTFTNDCYRGGRRP